MRNLIRVQFYRFTKHPLSRYALIPGCILSVLIPILFVYSVNSHVYADAYDEIYTLANFGGFDSAHALSYYYMFFFCTLIMIPLAYGICSAFYNKTVIHELIGGYSIHQILISRLIVAAGITFLLSLITVILPVSIFTLANGWTTIDSFDHSHLINPYLVVNDEKATNPFYSTVEAICCVVLVLFTLMQASILCVLSSCIARESSSSLSISWMLYFFSWVMIAFTLPLILEPMGRSAYYDKVIAFFAACLPGTQASLLFRWELPVSQFLPAMLIVGIAIIVLFYLIAYLRLKHSEIREEI